MEWLTKLSVSEFGALGGILVIVGVTIAYVMRFLDKFTSKLEEQNSKYEDRISELEEKIAERDSWLEEKNAALYKERNRSARLTHMLIINGIEIPEGLV